MIPFVDEQRHFYDVAGIHGSGFASAGSGITADARFGLNNYQFYGVGQFHAQDTVLVGNNFDIHVLFQEVDAVADLFFGKLGLFVGVVVHEHVAAVAFVQVLHDAAFNVGFGQAFTCVEGALYYSAGGQVAHFGPYEGGAFAGFYMLEFHYLPGVIVDGDSQTGFEFVGRYHKYILLCL